MTLPSLLRTANAPQVEEMLSILVRWGCTQELSAPYSCQSRDDGSVLFQRSKRIFSGDDADHLRQLRLWGAPTTQVWTPSSDLAVRQNCRERWQNGVFGLIDACVRVESQFGWFGHECPFSRSSNSDMRIEGGGFLRTGQLNMEFRTTLKITGLDRIRVA